MRSPASAYMCATEYSCAQMGGISWLVAVARPAMEVFCAFSGSCVCAHATSIQAVGKGAPSASGSGGWGAARRERLRARSTALRVAVSEAHGKRSCLQYSAGKLTGPSVRTDTLLPGICSPFYCTEMIVQIGFDSERFDVGDSDLFGIAMLRCFDFHFGLPQCTPRATDV